MACYLSPYGLCLTTPICLIRAAVAQKVVHGCLGSKISWAQAIHGLADGTGRETLPLRYLPLRKGFHHGRVGILGVGCLCGALYCRYHSCHRSGGKIGSRTFNFIEGYARKSMVGVCTTDTDF